MAELKNLIVNGAARVNGDIYGNLKGNADTATNADTLDGKHASEFSLSGHTHSQYSQTGHTHTKSEITNFPTLATVATSGSYNDLSNKPTIPSAVTESTVSGWGFTKNTGTVTSVAVKMNGNIKGTVTTSGTIDLGTVITSHQNISGKADKASITAGTAGTSSATSGSSLSVPYVTMNAQGIVTGYGTHTHTVTGFGTYSKPSGGIPKSDLASAVQTSLGKADTALQSHQSIKTINNQSIIGTGNITISSGVEEAPIDNTSYVRRNGIWSSLSGALNESVVLHISNTFSDAITLTSATITIRNKSDNSVIHVLQWTGIDLLFIIKDGINYTVEFSNEVNFVAPTKQEYTAFGDTVRNISAVYQGILPNGVYIGYTDGDASRYNYLIEGKTVKGVIVKSSQTSFYIYPYETYGAWGSDRLISGVATYSNASDSTNDFNGKTNTVVMLNSGWYGLVFGNIRDIGSEWYLASSGEMMIIRDNRNQINTALNLINGTTVDFSARQYWSSTQNTGTNAFYWYDMGILIGVSSAAKSYSLYGRVLCPYS